MAYEFKLPDLGEGVAEGEIARWLVEVGQEIEEDDPLVEIQTDKTTVEIPSPASGTVARILVQAGELVPVGTPLVEIGDGEVEAVAEEPGDQVRAEEPGRVAADEAAPAQPSERVKATPLVRRIAAELGVDLSGLAGTGPGGRVTEGDVRRFSAMSGGRTAGRGPERRVPLRGVRRLIAQHLTTSHREVPAVTVVEECDFTALSESRGERSYLPYLMEAVVAGLKEFPELNATLDGEEIVFWERYDLGLAVQTDEGLVVPVLRAADAKSIDELEEEARRLADGARAGTLAPEELRGSTFTVTSAGKLGGLFATPLVNHPEVAILGLHRIGSRPAVVDGELAVRQIGWLACTFDHRVVDGARASAFLLSVIARLEGPA
ncbi:MAG TPA: dihydrolipoamide acetyltransferase family protein [Gaiellaceae bacterium]|nr:dihydrolipoamide acetyltransferase family protein [Gaiellaceae bacterium]